LFPARDVEPRFVEVDRAGIRVENCRQFGGPWLELELTKRLGLDAFLERALPPGRERVPWSLTALILVVARLCEPSSELHIAEHFYRQTALADLLGVSSERVDDNRLYRGLDALLPHKRALEAFLRQRFGELFAIEYDLLLYDVTSTYFEGQAEANPLAKRGYSRDHRPDCKQVCIGLVVTRCGLPLGYEVFAGNRRDSTTLQEIVETMEARYGQADRIWALDRGMVSEENLDFLRAGGRRYIVGTLKSQLKRFERQLLSQEWRAVRDGLEVQLCACPDGGPETYVLCRSRDRRQKERAMHERFERRIEEGLTKIAAACARASQKAGTIERRVGRLLGQNTRAAGLFDVRVQADAQAAAQIAWTKVESWRRWAQRERRGLPAADQRARLERRGAVAGLHAVERRGSGVSHSEERPVATPGVASEARPRAGPHPGLLLGLRAVEVLGATLPPRRPGRRAAPRAGGAGRAPRGRCRAAHQGRPRAPPPLRHATQRTPTNPPPTPRPHPPRAPESNRPVVEKTPTPALPPKHLRRLLGKLG
jgi:hypothetical protein